MAISLGSIVVELLANTASFQSGMSKASYEGRKAAKEIHQSFDEMGSKIAGAASGALASLGQFGAVAGELVRGLSEALEGVGKSTGGLAVAATALGALAAAGIAAAAGLVELGKSGAELVEHLSQVSQKTGIGVRDLQIFEAAGKTVGLSLDDMVTGLRKFDQALLNTGKGTASQGILKTLGVTARDNKEALLQVADAFAKMDDGARKNSDAVALFGRSGLSLIPLLNKGRDGIKEWEEAVDRLGPKIGKEAVEANEKYRKSVEELSLSWDKVKVDVEQSVVPALAKASSFLADALHNTHIGTSSLDAASVVAIISDQKTASDAATVAAKAESAAKETSLRKQEELNAAQQKGFETLRAGGSAAYALSQARLDLEGAVQNGLWEQAKAIQSQLPGLQKAADLEAQRKAHAEQLAHTYAAIQKTFESGTKPLLKLPVTDLSKGTTALFGEQPKNPLEGAPDLGGKQFADLSHALDGLQKDLSLGKNALDAFYSDWTRHSKLTAESVNADFDAQLAHWQGLLALGQVTEAQGKDIFDKIQRQREETLKGLRQATGTSTFRDAWQDMFTEIAASGRDFARSITADIGSAIESLNAQLVKFVVTGKGLSFKQIGQSLEENLVSSVLKKGESSLFGSLGNLLGFGGNTKPDGSSAQAALWVQMATGTGALSAAGIGALPLGSLGNIGNLLGNSSGVLSTLGSGLGKIGGGIGGFFGNIASFFGGFLAEGGDTQPGKAYIVGEKRPELFVPRSAGTVVPSVQTSNTKTIVMHNHLHVNGVTDADSFKKSQTQIFNGMSRAQQHAMSRA